MFYGNSNSRNDNVFSTMKRNTLVANSGRKPRVECGLRVDLSDREDASSRVKYLCYVKERIIYHIQKGARKSLCDSPLQGRFFDQYWSVK